MILASHAVALLVATPGLISASLTSANRLARVSDQLDLAAKGIYILVRDLETMSRLVARLSDEIEHMMSMVRFWGERSDGRCEVTRRIMTGMRDGDGDGGDDDSGFVERLDELEEHLYLCFMTVNRARNLVVKEVLDPGQCKTRPDV